MVNYFWDSYAVIELVRGSQNYAKYSQEPVAISIFNLVEIYWSFLNECGGKADEIFNLLREAVVDIDDKEPLKDVRDIDAFMKRQTKLTYDMKHVRDLTLTTKGYEGSHANAHRMQKNLFEKLWQELRGINGKYLNPRDASDQQFGAMGKVIFNRHMEKYARLYKPTGR